jgi:tripartite-type tricarboxylate transporter receptor subunit TctC
MTKVLLVSLLLALSNLAFSQIAAYPTKPIRLIVPFTPGSASDVLARTVGERLSASWQQTVTVENRPGAGGVIATGQVAKAVPDGYSLIVVSAGHVVNALLYGNLTYDTLTDFHTKVLLWFPFISSSEVWEHFFYFIYHIID